MSSNHLDQALGCICRGLLGSMPSSSVTSATMKNGMFPLSTPVSYLYASGAPSFKFSCVEVLQTAWTALFTPSAGPHAIPSEFDIIYDDRRESDCTMPIIRRNIRGERRSIVVASDGANQFFIPSGWRFGDRWNDPVGLSDSPKSALNGG